jgi:WD40 repeat protein
VFVSRQIVFGLHLNEVMASTSLHALPEELLLYILRFLNTKSLCQLQQTSKRFKRLCNDNLLWLNLMYRHLWWDFFQEIDPNYLPTVGGTCNWYEIFKREYIATRQWQRHQVRYHIVTFSPHGGWVRCLRFNQQRLYTGSHDCTVHVHNLSTHEWVATVKGHKAGVQCLQLISDETQNKDMLFTGSGDGSVRYLTLDCNRLQCVSSRGNGPQRRIFKSQVFHDYGESANVSVKSLLARSPDDLLLVGSEHIDVFKVSTKELMKRIVIDKGCRANALQTDNRDIFVSFVHT